MLCQNELIPQIRTSNSHCFQFCQPVGPYLEKKGTVYGFLRLALPMLVGLLFHYFRRMAFYCAYPDQIVNFKNNREELRDLGG